MGELAVGREWGQSNRVGYVNGADDTREFCAVGKSIIASVGGGPWAMS